MATCSVRCIAFAFVHFSRRRRSDGSAAGRLEIAANGAAQPKRSRTPHSTSVTSHHTAQQPLLSHLSSSLHTPATLLHTRTLMKRTVAGAALLGRRARPASSPLHPSSSLRSRGAFSTPCRRCTHLQPRTPSSTLPSPSPSTLLLLHSRPFSRASPTPASKEGTSARYAFTLTDVTKRFPTGRSLFTNLRLAFYDGAKIGVLGVNGCGKSSFLRIIAGVDDDYEGKAVAYPGYRVGYLAQEPELDEERTVIDNVREGVKEKQALLTRFDAISDEMGREGADLDALLAEQGRLQEAIDRDNLWELEHEIDRAMHALSCPPPHALAHRLSGGERRRVALARLLLSQPDILLLDEPTNHLDAASVAWLEHFLSSYRGLVIAITHDRYFLDNVAGYILEIDGGKLYPHKGNYASWLDWRQKRLRVEAKRNVVLEKMIARELSWVRGGHRGQQAKSKVRMDNYESMQEQRRERKLNKRSEGGALLIPEGPPLHESIILEVKGGSYWHDDCSAEQPLLSDVNLTLYRDDIVGIVGVNGAGKSTLLHLLIGRKRWKAGSMRHAPSLRLGYVDQQRQLDPEALVWQEIVGTKELVPIDVGYSIPARAYVAQFNFSGADQSKRVGSLSGGERNRVNIAKSLNEGSNVIVLDEPTNDLDVDTLRGLEDAIEDWGGAAIIVSHDRWFLDRVCNKLIVVEGGEGEAGGGRQGHLTVYEGGWSEYEAEQKRLKSRGKTESAKAFKKLSG